MKPGISGTVVRSLWSRFIQSPLALGASAVTWLLLLILVLVVERSWVQTTVTQLSFDARASVWASRVEAIHHGLDEMLRIALVSGPSDVERGLNEIQLSLDNSLAEVKALETEVSHSRLDPVDVDALRHRITRVGREASRIVELSPNENSEDRASRLLSLTQEITSARTALESATERRSNWFRLNRFSEIAGIFGFWITQVPYAMCVITIVGIAAWITAQERVRRGPGESISLRDLRQDLADHSPVPLLALSREGRILWSNIASQRLLSRTRDQIDGHFLIEFSHTPEEARSVVSRFSSAETLTSLPFLFVDDSGRLINTTLSATFHFGADGGDYLRVVIADISRSMAAENAYRATEHKLRTVIENLPSGIFLTNSAGQCEFTNDTWCRLAGMSRERAMGSGWADALHPEDRERVIAEWQQAMSTGGDFRSEYRFLTPTGEVHWINGHAVPLRNEHGQVVQYLGNVIDVSAMKATKDRLRGEQKRLNGILETAIDGIIVLDERGTIELANPALHRLFGYSEEELIGQNVSLLMPSNHGAQHHLYLQKHLKHPPGQHIGQRREVEGIDKQGRRFPLELSVSMTRDGDEVRFTGILHDISERYLALEKLRASEERLDLAISGSSDVIWDLNLATGEAYFSPRLAIFLGINPADIQPSFSWLESRIHPADLPRHLEGLSGHLQQNRPYQLDFRVRTDAGDYRWLLARGKAVRDESGHPVRIAGSLTDITEHKRQEEAIVRYAEEVEESRHRIEQQAELLARQSEELAHASREAETAAVAKGQFLANMSHEIRTPMNAVLGMTDLVLDGELDPEQRELLMSVKSSGQHLLSIVNDILDFSKIEAGKLLITNEPFVVQTAVEETLTLLRASARAKGLDLDVMISPNTPKKVVGDADRLRQVLINLVGNAIKFTARGGVSVSIHPSTETGESDHLQFVVEDTGIGIPAEKLQSVFNPFEQADVSTTRRFGGTGLGLAIVRTIVEQMGGRVWVESVEGRGSRFQFTARLPDASRLPRLETADLTQDLPAPISPANLPERAPLRVVVAEDNAVNRKVISEILSRKGELVTLVENGRDAVAAAAARKHDLILLDLQMPEVDGIEAVTAIRADEADRRLPRLPLILLTASTLDEDRKTGLTAGADGFLTKPVDRNDLFREIERVLTRTRQRSERARLLVDTLMYRTGGDWEIGIDLCGLYSDTAPAQAAGLVLAAESGDFEAVRRIAHQLRGSTSTFGEGPLFVALSTIEYAAEGDQSGCDLELIRTIPDQTQELISDLAAARTELALRSAADAQVPDGSAGAAEIDIPQETAH